MLALVITTHQTRERHVQAALSLAKQTTLAEVGDTCLLRIMDDDEDCPAKSSAPRFHPGTSGEVLLM